MKEEIKQIYLAFDGKLVGNSLMKKMICETLYNMPEKIVDEITQTCWFFGSLEDAWAFTFRGNDLRNQSLVFLSDHLFFQEEYLIKYTIAHEIGHVILKHRNSVLEKQSKEEIRKQEKEADTFAKKYI
jgi:Zn-dependent protease with chaperone function